MLDLPVDMFSNSNDKENLDCNLKVNISLNVFHFFEVLLTTIWWYIWESGNNLVIIQNRKKNSQLISLDFFYLRFFWPQSGDIWDPKFSSQESGNFLVIIRNRKKKIFFCLLNKSFRIVKISPKWLHAFPLAGVELDGICSWGLGHVWLRGNVVVIAYRILSA